MPAENIHRGHRKRLREKFLKSGLSGFHDYEIVELLQIDILDHIIIAEDDYYSFSDSGKLQQFKDNFVDMKIKGIISTSKLRHQDNIQSLN